MEYISELWLHQALASLIVSNGAKNVVIDAEELATMAGVEVQAIIATGEEIAMWCTEKFSSGSQSFYDWCVVYVPELCHFVATKPQCHRVAYRKSC